MMILMLPLLQIIGVIFIYEISSAC